MCTHVILHVHLYAKTIREMIVEKDRWLGGGGGGGGRGWRADYQYCRGTALHGRCGVWNTGDS